MILFAYVKFFYFSPSREIYRKFQNLFYRSKSTKELYRGLSLSFSMWGKEILAHDVLLTVASDSQKEYKVERPSKI